MFPQDAVADERSRDTDGKSFVADIAAQRIKVEHGFDKDHWSAIADAQWRTTVDRYCNHAPYGPATRTVNEGEVTDIRTSVSTGGIGSGRRLSKWRTPVTRNEPGD